MKLISIVTPAYNEADCIEELASRLQAVFEGLPHYAFEVIVVENGSTDATYAELLRVRERDDRFKILQFARNFGFEGGVTAGLAHATGDAAVVMTADLQDPPELIPEFISKWEEGYENIYMVVTARHGVGPLRRLNSRLFYWVAGRLTEGRLPRNVSDFRLVDRRVYETINAMPERNRFSRGMFAWVGYRSIGIERDRPPRHGGTSKAHTLKVVDLALRGIFANSNVPLKAIPALGLSLAGLSFLGLLYVLIARVAFGSPFRGFATVISFSLLLFGFLFVLIGIVGWYVGLVYEEVKRRPVYIVRQRHGFEDSAVRRAESARADDLSNATADVRDLTPS